MALQSMTGFARTQGQFGDTSWVWELRSVNGKALDPRVRVPPGFDAVEMATRKIIQNNLKRGNIQISLSLNNTASMAIPYINTEAVDALLEAAKELQAKVGGELPTTSELMSMRGVVELGEKQLDEATKQQLDKAIMENLEIGVQALVEMRINEGVAIAEVLHQQVDKIGMLHQSIEQNDARTPTAIKAQLQEQVDKLVESNNSFDQERLHQEVAIIAAKADLQEELDRLVVHVKAAKELLNSERPVGRRLDFLAQEFNRECNTICSKSNSAEVTSLGLDMKLIIDQFREQLQNME